MEKKCKSLHFDTEPQAYEFIEQWRATAAENTDNTIPEFAHFCPRCRKWHVSTNKGTVAKETYDRLLVSYNTLLKTIELMQAEGTITEKVIALQKKLANQHLKNKELRDKADVLEKQIYFQEHNRKIYAGIEFYILENEKIQNALNWYKAAWKSERNNAEDLRLRQSSIAFFEKLLAKERKKVANNYFEEYLWYVDNFFEKK